MDKLFTTLIVLALPLFAMGQERTISGTVVSGEDNQSLPGVNVLLVGTTTGTVTDAFGNFTISVPEGAEALVFSFVGYETQQVAIGQQTTIQVVLMPNTETLDEVVVIGYGTVRKSDLTGAVSSVRGEDLTKIPAVSPMQALQGKVAGLQVTSASGAPGSGTVVRIRGQGTFNNSSPLYVVDGVILNDIDFLNPADIASLEVLKDASSTAIYGARGANGIIIVTTKNGIKGGKPVINFNAEYGIQQVVSKIDLLSGREYANYVNAYDPGTYNNPDVLPNTDWQDLLFKPASIQNYQFSASGASDKHQYYLSLGYFDQEGIIEKSNYSRVTAKLNNTFNLAKFVRLGSNLTITPFKQQNTNGNVVLTAYRALPILEVYQPNGSYTEVPNVGNPIADIEYTNNFDKGVRGIGNFFGEVNFLDGFSFKSSFSVDAKYVKNTSFTPQFFVSPQQANATSDLSKRNRDDLTILWENTLTYHKEIGRHRFDLLAGYTYQNTQSEYISVGSENVIRDEADFWYLPQDLINLTSIDNVVEPEFYYSMLSTLFRANYSYDDRFLLTATFRRDGSSKFARNNQYASFPSFALGWNLINESFMKDIDLFSNVKLRASWGKLGNEKINYLQQFSLVSLDNTAVFGEALVSGATYSAAGNPNLKWETTTQADVGIELGFLNDRLTAEFDYYHRVTSDILIPLDVPGYLGNGSQQVTFNAGEILNKGFEFNIGWNDQLPNGVKYRVNVLGNTIHNEVLTITGGGSVADELFGPEQLTRSAPGLPIGSFYGYVVDGIFQDQGEIDAYPHLDGTMPGDLRFVDRNDDKKINNLDRTEIGSPIPDFIYGASLGVAWKGIDLSVDLQGEVGASILNYKETVRPDRYNFERHALDYWRPSATSTTEPRAGAGGSNWGAGQYKSTRFIQSADFFRVRNITLAYSLPSAWAQKAKMSGVRVFARGTNLITVTDYTGYSPEVASENPLENRVDRGGYPISSIYTFGLNVTF